MNKLAALLLVSLLLCAGCAHKTPPAATPPPPPVQPAAIIPPKAGVIDMPSAKSTTAAAYPKNAIVRQKPLASVEVYPGSLRENIERIAAHYGWHQVVWDSPQDYQWVGYAQIQGNSLAGVLHDLLYDFPLQAVLYQGNHVLYIHPRTLK